jgi:leucyl aminopeptidase (aminopeptidase T)
MVFGKIIKSKPTGNEIFNTCKNALMVVQGEDVCIVYTKDQFHNADLFSHACRELGAKISMAMFSQNDVTDKEPHRPIAEAMKNTDIVLCITNYSLTHTRAVTNALKTARVASMPGFNLQMLPALDVDYKELACMCKKIETMLDGVKTINIKTALGTDITFSCLKRKGESDDGLLDKKGTLHNIPAGECGIAPIEDSANGVIVVDTCMVGVEKFKRPVYIIVKNGKIKKIEGHEEAKQMNDIFASADVNARTLCEFSLGLNPKATLIGNVLNDEKVLGTCHFAFGDNINMGGVNKSNVHIDGVVKNPTVTFDDEIIMKEGVFRWRW